MRVLAVFSLIIPVVSAAANADAGFAVPKDVQAIVVSRCIECHSGDSAEGGVRFDTLAELQNEERLELLNKGQEQLFFGLMPPEDAEQPRDAEREKLLGWLSGELKKFGASKLNWTAPLSGTLAGLMFVVA